jgi:phosphatidylglycerophosphate synthase
MIPVLGPLAPLAPALAISAYFVVMLIVFSVRARIFGFPVDADVARRPASKLLGRFLRHYFMWLNSPWERACIRAGITPNMLTAATAATAMAAAVAFSQGWFATGGWLYLLTGILDIMDGRVARATGKVTTSGAYFDSVMDRYAEILVFGGMAYFYRDSWVLFLVLAACLGSIMVSYTRARGESLGIGDLNIGAMQRPERLFYLGVVSALAPIPEALLGHGPLPAFPPTVAALILLTISGNLTAIRRILHTMRRLDAQAEVARAIPATTPVLSLRKARESGARSAV